MSLLIKYFIFLIIMLGVAALFLILDGYMKTRQAESEPEIARATYKKLIKDRDENIFN